MPTYEVRGARKATGEDCVFTCRARSAVEAERKANRKGVLVDSVVEIESEIAIDRWRLAATIVGALGLLGAFLPWVSVGVMGDMIGVQGDGIITASLFGLATIAAVARLRDRISWLCVLFLVGCSVASGFIAFDKIMGFHEIRSNGNPFLATAHLGIGLYLTAFAACGLFVIAVACRLWKWRVV